MKLEEFVADFMFLTFCWLMLILVVVLSMMSLLMEVMFILMLLVLLKVRILRGDSGGGNEVVKYRCSADIYSEKMPDQAA